METTQPPSAGTAAADTMLNSGHRPPVPSLSARSSPRPPFDVAAVQKMDVQRDRSAANFVGKNSSDGLRMASSSSLVTDRGSETAAAISGHRPPLPFSANPTPPPSFDAVSIAAVRKLDLRRDRSAASPLLGENSGDGLKTATSSPLVADRSVEPTASFVGFTAVRNLKDRREGSAANPSHGVNSGNGQKTVISPSLITDAASNGSTSSVMKDFVTTPSSTVDVSAGSSPTNHVSLLSNTNGGSAGGSAGYQNSRHTLPSKSVESDIATAKLAAPSPNDDGDDVSFFFGKG